MFIINQILSAFFVVNKCSTYISNTILEFLEDIKIYEVVHDVVDPFTKTYSCILCPYMYFTLNHSTYAFTVNNSCPLPIQTNFFESGIVHNKKLLHFFSKHKFVKISNDYKILKFISMSVSDTIFHKLQTLYTDFDFTANHICTILYIDLGSKVLCTDDNLDEFTFKDIELII
jgi:hypothetical protein